MGEWRPDADEATFIGQVVAIDLSLAGHVTELLRKGHPLREVKATLDAALKIAAMFQGGRK